MPFAAQHHKPVSGPPRAWLTDSGPGADPAAHSPYQHRAAHSCSCWHRHACRHEYQAAHKERTALHSSPIGSSTGTRAVPQRSPSMQSAVWSAHMLPIDPTRTMPAVVPCIAVRVVVLRHDAIAVVDCKQILSSPLGLAERPASGVAGQQLAAVYCTGAHGSSPAA